MTEHIPMQTVPQPAGLMPTDLSEEGQALLLLAFVLVQSREHKQAINVLEGLRHWEAQSTGCLPLLTQCYLELGLFAEALPLAQELVSQMGSDQQNGDALCATRMVAQALWGLNRKEEAKAVLDKALQPLILEEAHALADA